jgi:ketosteroid isomerase-like protein
MTVRDVAAAFAALCKAGDHQGAAAQFNAPDIVSLEDFEGPMARAEGAAAVQAKGEWWYGAHEVHEAVTEGPWVHGNQFTLRFTIDVTERASGKRSRMDEIGLYTVRDGKVVEERFFYA